MSDENEARHPISVGVITDTFSELAGTDEGLVESELYAAKATAFIIMASNSTGVSFPNLRCLRLR